jgi:pimeloyl-ACP methyl ester carboxylesterase
MRIPSHSLPRRASLPLSAALVVLLSACGGGTESNTGGSVNPSTAPGTLIQDPPLRVSSLSGAEFTARLGASAAGQGLVALAGSPKCGVDFHYMEYQTVGAKGEAVNATGALMVPSGTDAACSGPRPVVVYAHGTSADKRYNLANIADSSNSGASEGTLLAAAYAAQGYIVVAPNYVGYDKSTSTYHPYLNADQQAKEMMHALAAARTAMPRLLAPTSENGKVFVLGYSQGGHVAVATQKAMEAAGQKVTAVASGSGPLALSAMVDAAFTGKPIAGGTVFSPLLTTSYQNAYGNLYSKPSDMYNDPYAASAESIVSPMTLSELLASGKVAPVSMFSTTFKTFLEGNGITVPANFVPLFAATEAAAQVKTTYAQSVVADIVANSCTPASAGADLTCKPANGLRAAAAKNDLRSFMPKTPLLMCFGANDPTVFSAGSTLANAYYQAKGQAAGLTPVQTATMFPMVDVDSASGGAADPFGPLKVGFAGWKTSVATAAGGGVAGQMAVVSAYHSGVAPFCAVAARGYFGKF